MKKAITLLLSLVLALGVFAPAATAAKAPTDIAEPRYVRISLVETTLDISSAGLTTDYCKVKTSTVTDKIDLTMELQRLENGKWNTIKTWTGSGTGVASLDKTWYVLSGYEYQLKNTVDIHDKNGVWKETVTEYSNSVEY